MDVTITLKNYRCFPDESPARIAFRNGLTAFVGVNNSGKSSILKFFYEFRDLFSRMRYSYQNYLMGNGIPFTFAASVLDQAEVFTNTNKRDLSIEIEFLRQTPSQILKALKPDKLLIKIARDTNLATVTFYASGSRIQFDRLLPIQSTSNTCFENNGIIVDVVDVIPVFETLTNTFYIAAFRNVLNVTGDRTYFDITIGQEIITKWRQFKTGDNIKLNNLAMKLTDDIKRIFEFKTLEIDASDDVRTFKVRIDSKPYRLTDIGSGFAQFLVTFINIALAQPSYIMIDEPEQNLHPRLQIDFLITLASYVKNGVLFGTHNIGLARSCADHIYCLKKIGEGQSLLRDFNSTASLSEFLGELGFSGYKELGFDKVLLVEGPTDIKTFQQFLRFYKKDHKIVVLPLGGSGMINGDRECELNEMLRITLNISAVIDSEVDSENAAISTERQAFVATCETLGIHCHTLMRRATENYFSDRAIKLAKGETYMALSPYQSLGIASPAWGKQDNWRIAMEMTKEELDNTDLGQFLGSL